MFNASSASGLNREESEQPKKTRGRKKKIETNIERESIGRVAKRRKKRARSSDIENEIINENEKNQQEEEEEEEEENEITPTKKKAPEKIRTAAEILAKKTRAPAQEKVSKEIHEINERIIQLVQVKNMGMATAEQEKQLKKLLVEQKKKTNDLKRLKTEQSAKKRARDMKKVKKFLFYNDKI